MKRWFLRTFFRVDPARDERQRAKDIADMRVVEQIHEMLESENPHTRKLGQILLNWRLQCAAIRWMMRARK